MTIEQRSIDKYDAEPVLIELDHIGGDLRYSEKKHTEELKRHLRKAAQQLTKLGIFPSVFVEERRGTTELKLLHFKEIPAKDSGLPKQFYLSENGEILFDYSRKPNQISRVNNLAEAYYTSMGGIDYPSLAQPALTAVEREIQKAVGKE